jgi:hypothetical protein
MNAKADILLRNFAETKELLEISPISNEKENINSSRKGISKLMKVNLYKMAAMVRILTITPEQVECLLIQIWHSLEVQNHLNASRLLLSAKGVYNSILSKENEEVSALMVFYELTLSPSFR